MPFDAEASDRLLRLDRLAKIADAVEAVAENQLRLEVFYHEDPKCGATACAIGWGLVSAPGRRIGRTFMNRDGDVEQDEAVNHRPFWEVVGEDVGITTTEALSLFSGDNRYYTGLGLEQAYVRPTPQQVAGKIRELWAAKVAAL